MLINPNNREEAVEQALRRQLRCERRLYRRLLPIMRRTIKRVASEQSPLLELSVHVQAERRAVKGLLEAELAKCWSVVGEDESRALRATSGPAQRREIIDDYESDGSWLAAYAAGQARLIAETTQSVITAIITTAIDAGTAVSDLGKVLRGKGFARAKKRAADIACTTTHTALMGGVTAFAERLGDAQTKEWMDANDPRVREWHQKQNIAPSDVVPFGSKFVVGGEEMNEPGDPNASARNLINCRCVMIVETL